MKSAKDDEDGDNGSADECNIFGVQNCYIQAVQIAAFTIHLLTK